MWAVSADPGGRVLVSAAGPDVAGALAGLDVTLCDTDDVSRAAAQADPAEPLLVVRAEIPTLGPAHARDAAADLAAGCDVTIGPTTSGSWYLLGTSHPRIELLEAAAPELLGTLFGQGLRVGMLRSERPLAAPGDLEALLADPLADPALRAAVA